MLRIAPRLTVILLCGSMLAGCASASSTIALLTGGETASDHAKKEAAAATPAATEKTTPTDLEGGIRQAQLMRVAGHYDDAIRVLSQLMLVASDDPRVVSEYGKTLAEKGRAQDAVEFLGRAIELSSNDWTLYSALGVSYDQLGNQTSARTAYEHALALRPEEPSVLNNYALSRMLAGDTDGARQLIGRAELAGGASDAKIAANITMLNKLAPAPDAKPVVAVAQKAEPVPAKPVVAAMPQAVPHPVAPMAQSTPRPAPVAQNAPRPIVPSMPPSNMAASYVPPSNVYVNQLGIAPANNGVVMQAVPFDPYAGPITLHPPKAALAKADIKPPKIVIIDAKPSSAKPADAKTADTKTAANAKPAAANAKIADAKAAAAGKVKIDIKPGTVKALPVKATGKDAIPALRMSANAY